MAARVYELDERAESLLRKHYDSRTDTITRLCKTLKVPRHVLKRWAQDLGLARSNKRRPWTEEDVKYLESSYHRRHIRTMAKHLNRTTTAVALKAKKLGIRRYGEAYTASSLALALGVDDHKVVGWIRKGLLEATRRQTDRERDAYYISEVAVRRFIIENPLEIDIRPVDGLWLIDLLANGPSPRISGKEGDFEEPIEPVPAIELAEHRKL